MSGCHAGRLRCPVCGNPDWHDRAPCEECTHCGLVVADASALADARAAIPARLAAGRAGSAPGDRWSLDRFAWRNAAWAHGYVLGGDRAYPAVARAAAVTLGMIVHPRELADARALIAAIGPRFDRVIVAIDAEDGTDALPDAVTVIAHPLAGDFAAQRNRVQAAASGWVLQLDCDETPDPALLDALGWLTEAADADGLVSLGLPRRNLVDGAHSALWPDIQYRLNHAEVRYAGIVHERPSVPFKRTSLALPGAIVHRLSGARVRTRTRRYAAMSATGARPEDEARLLRPFDAIADR